MKRVDSRPKPTSILTTNVFMLAFYNALRYNGKKAVLLAYPGEGHHLGGVANQKALTARRRRSGWAMACPT